MVGHNGVHAHFLKVFQRFFHGVDRGDGGGKGGLPLFQHISGLEQVKVEFAVGTGFRFFHRPFIGGDKGQSGRGHKGFLGAGHGHIHTPFVHAEIGGAETGNGIDDEQGGMAFSRFGHFLDGVDDGGGGFVMLAEDGFDLVSRIFRQAFFDNGRVNAVPPAEVDEFHIGAVHFGDLLEPFTEIPDGRHDHFIAGVHKVDHGGFKAARTRGGQSENFAFGPEYAFDLFRDLFHDPLEFGTAVIDHRPGHGPQYIGRNIGGAGQ